MPQDGMSCFEEPFVAFLAGAIYVNGSINNYEFMRLLRDFEDKYNVSLVGNEDFAIRICSDNQKIFLKNGFDEVLLIEGNLMTAKQYLYSLTTEKVREYFGIPNDVYSKKGTPKTRKKFFGKNVAM